MKWKKFRARYIEPPGPVVQRKRKKQFNIKIFNETNSALW